MNALARYQPIGPGTYNADVDFTMTVKGACRLVKRTATGVTFCGDGEHPIGMVFDDVPAGKEVAVWPIGTYGCTFLLADAGNIAAAGIWLLPAANGCVKGGTVPVAGFMYVSDAAALDGETIYAVSGLS